MATPTRAPKGGVTIDGTFYKGGQFLPDWMPNQNKAYRRRDAHRNPSMSLKNDIEDNDELKSLGKQLFFITKNTSRFGLVLKANQAKLASYGLTRQQAQGMIARYNKLSRQLTA